MTHEERDIIAEFVSELNEFVGVTLDSRSGEPYAWFVDDSVEVLNELRSG